MRGLPVIIPSEVNVNLIVTINTYFIREEITMNVRNRAESDNKIAVDIVTLQRMLNVGRNMADDIGKKSGAVFKIGRRKLFNVKKIEDYMDGLLENGDADDE